MKQKFHQLAAYKADENTAAAVSATASASPETRAAAAAAGTASADNGGENNPRTQALLGAFDETFPKSTAEKADDACARLFAELPIERRPRASAAL